MSGRGLLLKISLMGCVCCAGPLVHSEYLVTETCRCLTGRALKQSDYTCSAAIIIHHIIQVMAT